MLDLDPALDGLDFIRGVRAVAPADARLVVRAAEGVDALRGFAARRSALDARRMHFVDAPDGAPVAEGSAVWSWWMDDADLAAVRDLTCKVPADDPVAHELFVCTVARWGEVAVTHGGRRRVLPLTREHLLCKCFAADGALPSASLRLDGSLLLVFGFALGDEVGPVTPAHAATSAPAVLAAVELLCGRPRAGLDPWGLTLAAPLYPRLSLRPTVALDGAEATLTLARPEETTMVGCEADVEDRFRGAAERHVRAAWVTHSNRPGPPSLAWDALYDRVRHGDLRALAVEPRAVAGAQAGELLVRSIDRARAITGVGALPSDAWRLESPVRALVARQGDVDGVVLGPPLRAPSTLEAALRWWRLRDVAALPVGVHDALHVVWRWPGEAPRVAPAQRVVAQVEGARLTYQASHEGRLEPERWADFFPHGAFFGLGFTREGWAASLAADAIALPEALAAFAAEPWFAHWIARYCVAGAQGPSERLCAL